MFGSWRDSLWPAFSKGAKSDCARDFRKCLCLPAPPPFDVLPSGGGTRRGSACIPEAIVFDVLGPAARFGEFELAEEGEADVVEVIIIGGTEENK